MAAGDRPFGAGTVIGQYHIVSRLGAGGMGVVYRALDTNLNRPVAIKFLSGDLADVRSRRRFQREARAASSLNHPHILTVHDAGEFLGHQYLVTEFVDGGTLADWAIGPHEVHRCSITSTKRIDEWPSQSPPSGPCRWPWTRSCFRCAYARAISGWPTPAGSLIDRCSRCFVAAPYPDLTGYRAWRSCRHNAA